MTLRPRPIGALALAVAGALAVAACGSSSSNSSSAAPSSSQSGGGTVNGAGSTFAAPVYQQWGATLKSQGMTVNYDSGGSRAGVAQLTAGTVAYAWRDAAAKPADESKLKGP